MPDKQPIPITQLDLGAAEAEAAARVVASGWVAQGPQVQAFERAVAEYVGARFAVAVSSGTDALHLALLAWGIGPGDEVIVPSLSFVATANAVVHCGAQPVFADVDLATYNLDPKNAAQAITGRTKALMPVHQLGLPADLTPLRHLAQTHHLLLLEDAACAFGAQYQGQPIGGAQSQACCFSFHPRKIITTGEGGMITTQQAQVAERLQQLRNQGASLAAHARQSQSQCHDPQYPLKGFNARLTDIQAAIGVQQMSRLPQLLARRQALARRYQELLATIPGIQLPQVPRGRDHAFQSYMIRVLPPLDRDRVMEVLAQDHIASRPAVTAIHQLRAYQDHPLSVPLPNTETLARQGMMLPLFPSMTERQQERVAQVLASACAS